MQQWQVALNNTSFDRAGITKDCKEAICEYIWNGFEAGATVVDVSFVGVPMQEAMSVRVADNGHGIEFDTLDQTFGAFLSSIKNAASIRIKSQANKGKGRFSYLCFSHSAEWETVYEKDGVLKKYTISMSQVDRRNFGTSDVSDAAKSATTGTVVEFPLSDGATTDNLSYRSIYQKLFQEFSWFLYLNKSKNFTLKYEGIKLDYSQYIDEELSVNTEMEVEGEKFSVSLIVWKKSIDNSSKIYYLSDTGEIHAARNTGFNKNTVEFYHNVFVSSNYITAQSTMFLQDGDTSQYTFEPQDNSRKIFGELRKAINKLIEAARKDFLIRQADKQLADMEERGSLPSFPKDEYGQLRKKDFETITRELYCVEPKIFYRLNDKQEKSLLGFMNLLLSTEERENLLSIVEQVVSLTAEQRKNFADILQRTKLQFIVEAIGIIEKRMGIIQGLKQIVFDMDKFSNERDHIQKIIEQHFWLFGEQYHLLTADKTLATSLAEYEKIIELQVASESSSMSKSKSIQRADVFLYTQRVKEDDSSEMLIIELKAPHVTLSTEVFSQVERYAYTIRKEPRFNGANRKWKFYAVCASVDDDVKTKYNNFKQHGKLGLANIIENFEIYALSWDDIFQAFEARHKFLLEKLKLDFSQASTALGTETMDVPSREAVNDLTTKILLDTSGVTAV